MKEIRFEELKVIQMDILSIIDKFCEKHSIKYSMGCGTLLGAIRHKGYIPWDDDIDIYLLREEYNKLIKEFPEEYKNVKIASLERDKKWGRAYANAYDCRTEMQDGASNYRIGVSIDVYPIDSVPQDEKEWKKYNKKRLFYQHLYEMKVVGFRKGRSVAKNILLACFKVALSPFSERQIGKFLSKYAQKYNNSRSEYVFECAQGIHQKNRFKKSALMETINVQFEDRQFKSMKNYDEYLKNGFGDYMQLPPIEKRVTHHAFKAWWKE